jgi:hypothetical protein
VQSDTIQARLRRRAWIIGLVFIMTTAVAFGLFRATGGTSHYKTVAVVAPPAEVTNPAEALQYVGDFRAALSSDLVTQRSSRATGLSASKLQSRIGSKRATTDSAIIDVTYTSDHADANAKAVLQEVIDQTGAFLAKGRANATRDALHDADKGLAAANADADRADAAVNDFLSANGGVMPSVSVTALQNRILDLKIQGASAIAAGDAAGAAAVSRTEEVLTAQLTDARVLAMKITPLTQASDAAHERVSDALKVRANALDAAAGSNADVEVSYSKVNASVSQTETWLRQAVAAGAALAIVAALLIAWLPDRSYASRSGAVRRGIPESAV